MLLSHKYLLNPITNLRNGTVYKAASREMLQNACYCTVAWAQPSWTTALTALTASSETAELLSTAAALPPSAAGCQSAQR